VAILVGSASSTDAAAQHAEHVYLVAEGATPAPGIEEVSTSWQRCARKHGVDPAASDAPRILTSEELKDVRKPLEDLIFSSQEEIDRLYKVVREAGYAVLLCGTSGVAVEHRGEAAQASQFEYWGTWLGGVWSEQIEGTNGIGTCIAEERPVTIHRSQHFRSRHIDLSCSGAPVFDASGKLMAVLDVSAIDPELSERAHALTGALTIGAARAITERFFRERFRRHWIIAAALPEKETPGMLLAVDEDQRIIGADRLARTTLLLEDRKLHVGVSLWTLFERDVELFRRKDRTDTPTRLTIAGSNETCFALVTPPEIASDARRNPADAALHARPRLDLIGTLRNSIPPRPTLGGLSPCAMRRVMEYVEAHLSDSMDLAELAAVAGVSVFHFAREFKHSTSVTPHFYLRQKRVERAQDMLARTDLPLTQIALAAGFFDQSHLARHFRQMLGTTPTEFRALQR
jgi:transcriptional regulator of acetoin/glycerol metabolism/AraC-like DNA-binding protein